MLNTLSSSRYKELNGTDRLDTPDRRAALEIMIDDLFRPDFINLFDRFLKSLSFSLADYDAEDSRRVLHWIHEFALEKVTAHPLLSFVYKRIKSACEETCSESRIQLQRIHCNTSTIWRYAVSAS